MTDVEQLLTDHLQRRADAAIPRYDLEGIVQGRDVVSLVDLTEHRPRRPKTRTIVGLAAAVALVVALAGVAITADDDDAGQDGAPDVVAEDDDAAKLRVGGEVLVFQLREDGAGYDLAAQDPQTGAVRTLVATQGFLDCTDISTCSSVIRTAGWSADGRWVAFTVSSTDLDGAGLGHCAETTGLWVKGAVGEPRQLTAQCDAQRGPSIWTWSPDGARLAHVSVGEEFDTLSVIDPSDGTRTTLDSAIGHIPALDWSPDGTRIAYAHGNSVYLVDVDDRERSLLSKSFDDIITIAWSPDGSQILVHDQGRYRIQVMNADGSDLHSVLEGEDACCETEWSPKGDRILYMLTVTPTEDSEQFYSEVWTVSPDGSNSIKVYDAADCDKAGMESRDALPVWTPNGTQVAYYGCGEWVVANADGTGELETLGGFRRADQFVPLLYLSWAGGGLS